MSRRSHHGGRHHGRPHKTAERRPAAPSTLAPGSPPEADAPITAASLETPTVALTASEPTLDTSSPADADGTLGDPEPAKLAFESVATPSYQPTPPVTTADTAPADADAHVNGEAHGETHVESHGGINGDGQAGTCTAPQLRRFIKSRAYVPMHELRRRFAINGSEDDVTQVDVHTRRIYIGLPEREGRLLGELLRGGDVGFELSLDPITPIVVGVYPMRPVPRP